MMRKCDQEDLQNESMLRFYLQKALKTIACIYLARFIIWIYSDGTLQILTALDFPTLGYMMVYLSVNLPCNQFSMAIVIQMLFRM